MKLYSIVRKFFLPVCLMTFSFNHAYSSPLSFPTCKDYVFEDRTIKGITFDIVNIDIIKNGNRVTVVNGSKKFICDIVTSNMDPSQPVNPPQPVDQVPYCANVFSNKQLPKYNCSNCALPKDFPSSGRIGNIIKNIQCPKNFEKTYSYPEFCGNNLDMQMAQLSCK